VNVALRLIDEPAARAIVAGSGPPGCACADDFPAGGDRVAAGMFLQRLEADLDSRPFGVFLVLVAAEDTPASPLVIGGAGFHGGPDERGRVEVGYGIVPSWQGQGYATRALQLLMDEARRLGAITLLAETDPGNLASQTVLLRCGFLRSSADDHAIRFESSLGAG
jgi:RimJ/RimL family protein N-acetyltransferase